jgi:hypothetical protein
MKHTMGVLLVASLALVCVWNASAAFEPLFQTVEVQGKCTIQAPDEKGVLDAEENKAYPYGSQVRTGSDSAMTLLFDAANRCALGADASLYMGEDESDAARKLIVLDAGKISLNMAAGFEEANSLAVQSACADIGVLQGGKGSVNAMTEGDLNLVVAMAENATFAVTGPEFVLAALNNAAVSVACSLDQTFIRVKNVQGAFDVEVTDADGNPRVVSMEEGSAIKIWRKASEAADEMIVTLLITAPDGTLVEAINYRKTDGVEKLAAAAGEEGSDGEEPAAEGDDDDDDEGIDPGEDVETTPATTTLGGEDTETESESVVVGFGGPGPGRPTPTQIGFGRD